MLAQPQKIFKTKTPRLVGVFLFGDSKLTLILMGVYSVNMVHMSFLLLIACIAVINALYIERAAFLCLYKVGVRK